MTTEPLKYYMVVMEQYDKGKETPWRTEHNGLFRSYREASTYLIEHELFEVYPTYSCLFDAFGIEAYSLHFQIGDDNDDELHIAYIEEWKVLE